MLPLSSNRAGAIALAYTANDQAWKIETRTVTMHDTGNGQEAGYRDDAHLIEVAEAERLHWHRKCVRSWDKVDEAICCGIHQRGRGALTLKPHPLQDRHVGQLIEHDEISDPKRPEPNP